MTEEDELPGCELFVEVLDDLLPPLLFALEKLPAAGFKEQPATKIGIITKVSF